MADDTTAEEKAKAYRKQYYQKNREKYAEKNRRYYQKNKDKLLEKHREYYQENRDEIAAKAAKRRENNREEVREYHRKWREENKERIKESNRKYWANNKEKVRELNRQWRSQNRSSMGEYWKQYYKENKDKIDENHRQWYQENKEKGTVALYEITNKATGKRYIGESLFVENRWGKHRSSLKAGRHKNSLLQKDYNKHGPEAFEFAIIKEINKEDFQTEEQLKEHLRMEEAKMILKEVDEGKELYNISLNPEYVVQVLRERLGKG